MESNSLRYVFSKESEFHMINKFLSGLLFDFKKMAGWTLI